MTNYLVSLSVVCGLRLSEEGTLYFHSASPFSFVKAQEARRYRYMRSTGSSASTSLYKNYSRTFRFKAIRLVTGSIKINTLVNFGPQEYT